MMKTTNWRSTCALVRLCLAMGAFTLMSPADSRAGLVSFDFDQSRPFITTYDGAPPGTVTYLSSRGEFKVLATGLFFLSNGLPDGASQVQITGESAVIDLKVDQNGNLVGLGALTVSGAIDFDQDGTDDVSGTLVTATVNVFGAAMAGSAPWEFDGLFRFDGGLLTQSSIPLSLGGTFSDLFRVGETGGFDLVVEQQVSGILGDFAQDFSGMTNKGPVVGVATPEPNTALMMLISLGMVTAWCQFRRLD
jgi:hypothetical protein